MEEITLKNLKSMLRAARELTDRLDRPEKIPDSCYRGDVSRWNFGYFLSRREAVGQDPRRILSRVYGKDSRQAAVYRRAMKLCRDYREIYGLKIKEF